MCLRAALGEGKEVSEKESEEHSYRKKTSEYKDHYLHQSFRSKSSNPAMRSSHSNKHLVVSRLSASNWNTYQFQSPSIPNPQKIFQNHQLARTIPDTQKSQPNTIYQKPSIAIKDQNEGHSTFIHLDKENICKESNYNHEGRGIGKLTKSCYESRTSEENEKKMHQFSRPSSGYCGYFQQKASKKLIKKPASSNKKLVLARKSDAVSSQYNPDSLKGFLPTKADILLEIYKKKCHEQIPFQTYASTQQQLSKDQNAVRKRQIRSAHQPPKPKTTLAKNKTKQIKFSRKNSFGNRDAQQVNEKVNEFLQKYTCSKVCIEEFAKDHKREIVREDRKRLSMKKKERSLKEWQFRNSSDVCLKTGLYINEVKVCKAVHSSHQNPSCEKYPSKKIEFGQEYRWISDVQYPNPIKQTFIDQRYQKKIPKRPHTAFCQNQTIQANCDSGKSLCFNDLIEVKVLSEEREK